jgi:hypothetical protein
MRAMLIGLCFVLLIRDSVRSEESNILLQCAGQVKNHETHTRAQWTSPMEIRGGDTHVRLFGGNYDLELDESTDLQFVLVNNWFENNKFAGFVRGTLDRVSGRLYLYWFRGMDFNGTKVAEFDGKCSPVKPKF